LDELPAIWAVDRRRENQAFIGLIV
jgi:hypothetical protein